MLPVSALEKNDAEMAAADIMNSICGWKQSADTPFLSDSVAVKPYLDIFGDAAEQLAERLSFRIGNCKITDHTAVVDLSVSAVDIGHSVEQILLKSVGYLAIQQFYGADPDLNTFLGDRVRDIIADLPAITTHTSVYLVLGGDGEWKLDLGDNRNLAFVSALGGGGFHDYMDTMAELLEYHRSPVKS